MFDKDKDGFITATEFQKILPKSNIAVNEELGLSLDENQQWMDWLKVLDKNNDGVISK